MKKERIIRSVALAGMLGTALEDFDFLLASYAAALAWPYIFFPKFSPVASYLASITTFLVSFLARPLGSFVFGHYGDRKGRKYTLVLTLLTMGIASIIIALLPGYSTLGIISGIILGILRFVQGIGFGGEWGSVTTWILENVENISERTWWTGLVAEGYVVGGLGAAAGVTLFLHFNYYAFVEWGWRVLYIIGAAVIFLGAFIRYKLYESPIFSTILSKKSTLSLPALALLREKWKTVLRTAAVNMSAQTPFYVGISAMSIYLVHVIHVEPTLVTYSILLGTFIGGVGMLAFVKLSDKLGRKLPLAIAYILIAIFSIPYIFIINTGNSIGILLSDSFMLAFAFWAVSVMTVFLAENFEAKYRVSGSGVAYQIGVLLGVLPQTYIITYLIGLGKYGSIYIALVLLITAIISLIATIFSKETREIDINK